ncbi:MAG: bifunctional folylpolyglutamate synthase/dihydrofolate synthase [Halioglobus sp.]|nr:bifunctional folylpolyglutamate synthase/dihydrofolate synthase [Halioglobus sp.]
MTSPKTATMPQQQSWQEMSNASLEQWLQRLETIHPREIELGLERISTVARALELLPVSQPVVTVAGTNGKGSTVAVLEALLLESGYRTGTFTSPHVLRFNERIRVAGVDASDAEIIEAFTAIDAARGAISLTYFEFAALAALLVFKASAPDIIVLEVGLGGRLDAVNMVDPSVAVITSIDLDHQDWLGASRGEIACEKAGILRESRPVVIADSNPPPELLRCITEVGARPALFLGKEFTLAFAQGRWRAVVQAANEKPLELEPRECGSVLPENICAAVQAALLLGIAFDEDTFSRALARALPVGRRQCRWIQGRDYVLDVAHNPAAVGKLLEYLQLSPCEGRTIGLFSVMADKDIQSIVDTAVGHFDAWFLADQPKNERAARAVDIAALLAAAGEGMVSTSKNIRQALRRAQSIMSEGDRLVVFGSFTTVAAVLPLLDPSGDSCAGAYEGAPDQMDKACVGRDT